MTVSASGTLYGVGLGPGDPELVTLKAARIVARAPVIAYFRKKGRPGHARGIAASLLSPNAVEMAFEYPVTTEVHFSEPEYVTPMRTFYLECAQRLALELDAGRDVALLCEGDPFFYGSFLHMYDRIKPSHPVVVVPGITGMSGCWTVAQTPITYGDDVLTVLPGTLGQDALATHLRTADAVVIMKVGQNLGKIKAALRDAERFEDAIYVERGTMTGEKVVRLDALSDGAVPYFSIVLVPGGRGRRIQ